MEQKKHALGEHPVDQIRHDIRTPFTDNFGKNAFLPFRGKAHNQAGNTDRSIFVRTEGKRERQR
jgi:hypothetical protein